MIAGYVGGIAETVIMRLVDTLLAIPFVLLALTTTVLAVYFCGDGLRDVLDPRLRL